MSNRIDNDLPVLGMSQRDVERWHNQIADGCPHAPRVCVAGALLAAGNLQTCGAVVCDAPWYEVPPEVTTLLADIRAETDWTDPYAEIDGLVKLRDLILSHDERYAQCRP